MYGTALVLVAAATLAASAPAQGTAQLPAGQLIFSDEGTLFTIAPDGSGLRELGEVGAYEPRYSPHRTLLAYSTESSSIWISRSDGTNGRRLSRPPRGGTDSAPAWSPRGGRLAFARRIGSRLELRTIKIDGTKPRRLIGTAGWASPDWSPDGKRIAGDDHGRLWTVDVDGSNRRRLGPPSLRGHQPRWSPDGRRIAFINVAAGIVRVLDPRTGAVLTVFDEDSAYGNDFGIAHAWSPDGKWVAVMRSTVDDCVDDPTSTFCDHTELWIVSAAGSRATLIHEGPEYSASNGLDWR